MDRFQMLPQSCIVEDIDSPSRPISPDIDGFLSKRDQLLQAESGGGGGCEQRLLIVRQNTLDYIQENLFPGRDRLRDLVIIQDDHLLPIEQVLRRIAYTSLTSLYIVDSPLELPATDDCLAAFADLSLQSLVLSHTQLRHLPPCVFQMDSLEVLKVDRNCLDEIPAELGNLWRLRTFCCDRQRPRLRALPQSIRRLGQLQVLSFSGNRVEDISWISALSQLRVVRCDGNRLTRLPSDIVNLRDLTVLDVSHNRIEIIQPCLVELISRLYRFSYYNLTLQPRSVRHDRFHLISHLELEHLLAQATTRANAHDVTVAVVGETNAGKATLVGALSSERGVCRQDNRKQNQAFEVHQFEMSTGEEFGAGGGGGGGVGVGGNCCVNAIVMSNDALDNFTRSIRVDLYLLVVDLTSLEMHRGSQHLFLRHLSRLQMWLKALYEISPETPVLIVGTHAELVKTVSLMDIWNTLEGLLDQARPHHARRYAGGSHCPCCLLCAPKEHAVRHAFIKSRSTSGGFVDISAWQSPDQRILDNHVTGLMNGGCELSDKFRFPHVVGFYEVDSRKAFPKDAKKCNISIEHLKAAIVRLTRCLNKVEIPANWLTFICHLATLRDKVPTLQCIPTDDAIAIARSFEISSNHVLHMLRYFHRRGKVVFFEGDALLSKVVVLNTPWFVEALNRIVATFSTSIVHISDILACVCDRELERQLQKASRQRGPDGPSGASTAVAGQWFLEAMQRLEVCVPLLDQRENRFVLFPSLLESGSPSQEIWPDIPDWDEKQVTCDVLLRTLKPGFFVDLILKINRDGRKYLQVLPEPVPIYLSHHIVFFTCIDSGGCEDCCRLRKKIRDSQRCDEHTSSSASSAAADLQDDIIHKVHIVLHPRLFSLGIQVRGVSPCCTLKAVLGFLELFLDDIPEEDGGGSDVTCSSDDNGVSSSSSRWKSSGSPSCNSDGKGSLGSVPSLDEDDDREMYLLCPKCVLLRQMHPERISYPCPSSRRRAICSKWHNLGSWTRVVTGDYRFTSLDSTSAISLSTLPEHEHPRLVIVLPPSTTVSTVDWYLFSRMRFLEGFEIHFLCEYTGYWHLTEDAGFRLNHSLASRGGGGGGVGVTKRNSAPSPLTALFQLALPLIQCIQGVNENSQSSRLIAPVVADLIPIYEYLRKVDPALQVDPCTWLTKHKDRLVTMLTKVLSNASEGLTDIYSRASTAIGADLVFQAASPASRHALARLLRLDCSSGKFGALRPVYVGRDIRWVCEAHYEELRTMPTK